MRSSTRRPLLGNAMWCETSWTDGRVGHFGYNMCIPGQRAPLTTTAGNAWAESSISGERPARFLVDLARRRGLPECLVMDNGPELTSRAMFEWAQGRGVGLYFIEPGRPVQNAYVESFNRRFRDECPNEEWFTSMAHARAVIEASRVHYNKDRPHSALGYQTPAAYLATRAASLELRQGSAQLLYRPMIKNENLKPLSPNIGRRSADCA